MTKKRKCFTAALRVMLLAVTFAVCIRLNTGTAVAETLFLDTEGHWAEEAINRWADYGVISGYEGMFRPQDNITVAEFSAILDKVMGYSDIAPYAPALYTDIHGGEWYFDIMLRMVGAGVWNPDHLSRLRPTDYITRGEEAAMLAKAFGMKPLEGNLSFADNIKIPASIKPYVRAMEKAGYISGYKTVSGMEFRPNQSVTRAEAIAMINNMIGEYVNGSEEFSGKVEGNLLISAPFAVVKESHISGNLYIAAGADKSKITLDDVTVRGDTVITGGSEIFIKNSRLLSVTVDNNTTNTKIHTAGATNIDLIEMKSGGSIDAKQNDTSSIRKVTIHEDFPADKQVVLSGKFRSFENNAGSSAVNSTGAKFNNSPIVTPDEASIKAFRPTANELEVHYVSKSLGTIYMLVLEAGASGIPSEAEITGRREYSEPEKVFDRAAIRAYPNDAASYTFTGSGRNLTSDSQGHTVYALIEDETGNISRLEAEPAFFEPKILHMNINDPLNIYVSFDCYFTSGAVVEETFELYVLSGKKEKIVPFRAYSIIPSAAAGSEYGKDKRSFTYRLSLVYGDSFKDGDVIYIKPVSKNVPESGITAQKTVDLDSTVIRNFEAVLDVDGSVTVTGGVHKQSSVFFVMSDEYITDYFERAGEIAAQNFPSLNNRISYASETELNGGFRQNLGKFSETEYYYIYAVTRDDVTKKFSEVAVIVITPY